MTAVATGVIAIFSYLVWRINARQHKLASAAVVQAAYSVAVFDPATSLVRIEVLLVNVSTPHAVIKGWDVHVQDEQNRISISDGELVKTTMLKIPRYVGGPGWFLDKPTAFSIVRILKEPLSSGAEADVQITYAGGSTEQGLVHVVVPIDGF